MLVLKDGSDLEQLVSAKNRLRQYDFLHDSFKLWEEGHRLDMDRLIRDLNFYAVQYVSEAPGKYRSELGKNVRVGEYWPPGHELVSAHMQEFHVHLEKLVERGTAVEAAAYALWRLNWIHPFMQGNGRTARAFSYFVLCQKLGYWIPGRTMPERIRETRQEYCDLLQAADKFLEEHGKANLLPLEDYIEKLLTAQLTDAIN